MRDIKTREGFEFWDKLNALPRYAFLLSPSGTSVQKFEDKAMGNWIDVHEAQQIVDQAQERISELRDELGAVKGEYDRAVNKVDALQQRLTAADQRIDELAQQLAIESAIKEPAGEDVLWQVLDAAVGVLTRRAAPHAWESEAHQAGMKIILARREGLAATALTPFPGYPPVPEDRKLNPTEQQ